MVCCKGGHTRSDVQGGCIAQAKGEDLSCILKSQERCGFFLQCCQNLTPESTVQRCCGHTADFLDEIRPHHSGRAQVKARSLKMFQHEIAHSIDFRHCTV